MKKVWVKNIIYSGLLVASLFSNPSYADPGNWQGTYVGAHFGYAWGDFGNDNGIVGPDGSSSSWLGGAQVGQNWQINRFVLGIEGDASKIDMSSKNPSTNFDEDWMATFRGRAGYSFGRVLPYATAGLGLTDITAKTSGVGSDAGVQSGLAVGGGVDFLLADRTSGSSLPGSWIGRIEYLNVGVPNSSDNINGTTVRGGSDNNIVRVGLNYKF